MQVYTNSSKNSNLLILDCQRAIGIVQKAIDHDTKHNYAEAYKYYMNALDYFMLAYKCAFLIPERLFMPPNLHQRGTQ